MGEREIERRQRERAVVDDLDRLAAAPEHDDRAEGRILGEADDQLACVRAHDHRMNGDAVETSLRHHLRNMGEHSTGCRGDGLRAVETEHDAADIRLMADIGRLDLDDAGAVGGDQRRCDGRRRLRRRGVTDGGDRNAIGLEERHDVGRFEPFRAARERLPQDAARRAGVRREIDRQGRRRGHERVAILAPAHEMHEAAHRARRVIGNAGRFEDAARFLAGAEPGGEDGLLKRGRGTIFFDRVGDGCGGLLALRQRRRAMHHHDGVVALIFEQCRQSIAIARRIGVADDVDGIGMRPCRRQERIEPRAQGRGQFGEPAAAIEEIVDGEHADAAAVGQNGEPVARECPHAAERLGRVEKFVDVGDPQEAGTAEGRFIDGIGPGERAGMGGCGLGGAGVAPRFDDDDRLDAGRGARRRHEGLGVADRLDIEENRARRRVEGEIIEEVGEIHVGHVADRDEAGKADLVLMRPGDQGGRDRSRLRHDGEIAGRHRMSGETRIESGARRNDAEAIRTDDADAGLARQSSQSRAERVRAMVGIGGDDDGARNLQRRRLFDESRYAFARRREDGEIGRTGEIGEPADAGQAVDLLVARIDEPDLALETAVAQIGEHGMAETARPRARPDERQRARLEETVEMARGHGGSAVRRHVRPPRSPLRIALPQNLLRRKKVASSHPRCASLPDCRGRHSEKPPFDVLRSASQR